MDDAKFGALGDWLGRTSVNDLVLCRVELKVLLPLPRRLCSRHYFVCLSVCKQLCAKTSKRICVKFSWKVGNGPMNK